MMIFSRLACLLDYHRPVRHRVDRNGPRMLGECRYCGSRIQRIGHRKWRRVPKGAPQDAG